MNAPVRSEDNAASYPVEVPAPRTATPTALPDGVDRSAVVCSSSVVNSPAIVGAARYVGRQRWPEHLHYTCVGSFSNTLPPWAMENGEPLFGFIWTPSSGFIDLNWLVDGYGLSIIRVLTMASGGVCNVEAIDQNMQPVRVLIELPPLLVAEAA